jgi:hypothetical protein
MFFAPKTDAGSLLGSPWVIWASEEGSTGLLALLSSGRAAVDRLLA